MRQSFFIFLYLCLQLSWGNGYVTLPLSTLAYGHTVGVGKTKREIAQSLSTCSIVIKKTMWLSSVIKEGPDILFYVMKYSKITEGMLFFTISLKVSSVIFFWIGKLIFVEYNRYIFAFRILWKCLWNYHYSLWENIMNLCEMPSRNVATLVTTTFATHYQTRRIEHYSSVPCSLHMLICTTDKKMLCADDNDSKQSKCCLHYQ